MRTFAQKQNQPQKPLSSNLVPSNAAMLELHHHADPILHLQRAIGNQALQQMLKTNAEEPEVGSTSTVSPRFGHDFSPIPLNPPLAGTIQTKLAINQAGDEYEQEADRMAEQVMQMPNLTMAADKSPSSMTSLAQRRVDGGGSGLEEAPPIVHEVLSSPGHPLDTATRAFMEPRFGHDFSQVLVHTDEKAAQSAQAVNAHAYTVGQDMVFGAGRFVPGMYEGRHLIAHELTHVVQQTATGAAASRRVARTPKNPGFQATADDVANVESKLLALYDLLSDGARTNLQGRSTVAIALATDMDGDPTLVYTVASNRFGAELKAAAEKLGLAPMNSRGWTEGRGGAVGGGELPAPTGSLDKDKLPVGIGAPNDAEQLLMEGARTNHFKLHVVAISRAPCKDCGPALQDYEGGKLQVIHVPDPKARELRAAAAKAAQVKGPKAGGESKTGKPRTKQQGKPAKGGKGAPGVKPGTEKPDPPKSVSQKAVKPAKKPPKISGSSTDPGGPKPDVSKVKGKVGNLRAKGAKIIASIATIAKAVLIPIGAAFELMTALEKINQTLSKLSGEGWIFSEQLRSAKYISNATNTLINDYQGQHEKLEEMFGDAIALDFESQIGAGTDAFSDFCIDARSTVSAQLDLSRKLRDAVNEITANVRLGVNSIQYAISQDAILAAMAIVEVVPVPGIPKVTIDDLWKAYKDFQQISEVVQGLDTELKKHVELLENDLVVIDANTSITEQGWAGVSAYRSR